MRSRVPATRDLKPQTGGMAREHLLCVVPCARWGGVDCGEDKFHYGTGPVIVPHYSSPSLLVLKR